VIGQRPDPGRFVPEHGQVRLVVSRGPPPVEVPAMSDVPSVDAAVALLQSHGFAVELDRQHDESVPADGIIATDPSFPGKAPRDSVVKLLVSDGPAPVRVADVRGQSYDAAAQTLAGQRFGVARRDDFSSTVDKDKVIGTDPVPGAVVPRGSLVTIVVSKGPELIAVPNLQGAALEPATKQLQDLGLVPDTTGYLPGRTVRAQDPAAASMVPKGTKVTLFF
jgi:serine/threonine-protein kinase